MIVRRKSQLTGIWHELDLDVTQEQLDRFDRRIETGEYVQSIFAHLPKEEREFILTGITAQEWSDAFGLPDMGDDEDDDTEEAPDQYDDEKYVDENPR